MHVFTDDPAGRFIIAKDRVLKLRVPTTYSLAQRSFADCINNHPRCPAPKDFTLPTRVIDCLDPDNPKLHTSHGGTGRYVALSYVWGESQPNRTTTTNVDAYTLRIDPALLPQTIKDGIEATHTYGVRYLWVDALCILQDSEDDKAREIARILTIFRHSYFTIIAASAHKVSDGFLHDRSPSSPHDIALPFPCPDSNEVGTMVLSPVWQQYDASAELVNQRAWCLEERLLPARAFVYASHTLQFQCQTSIVNVGDAVCGPMIGQRLPDLLFAADATEEPIALTAADHRALRWAWREAVGDYTRRTVTKTGDKLVAFAAIAELFQRAWRAEYLAGLWRPTLLQDLLWARNYEGRAPRPTRYRAPSWSWAAVDGHVVASLLDDRLSAEVGGAVQSCEVIGCDAVPAISLLPLGKVLSGTLRLRAAMVKATWDPDAQMPGLYAAVDTREEATVPSTGAASPAREPTQIGCAYPDSTEDTREIWAVPVLWNDAEKYAAGLIITFAAVKGVHRRVGYFHSPEPDETCNGLSWMLGQERREITII